MPAKVEACVEGLLAKWKKDPSSRPEQKEGGEDDESQAWAICQSAVKQSYYDDKLTSHVLLSANPVLAGIGLTNRPFIKGMPPVSIVVEDGRKMIRVPFLKFGRYRHPKAPDGKLVFDDKFFDAIAKGFSAGAYGQKVLLDKAHKPDAGNQGEVVDIKAEGPYGIAYVEPTEEGLDTVASKKYLYASADLYLNWRSNEIKMSLNEYGFEEIDPAEEALLLYNPFHDKEGKFTTSTRSAIHVSRDRSVVSKALTAGVGAMGRGTLGTIVGVGGGIVIGSALNFSTGGVLTLGALAGLAGGALGSRSGAKAGWRLSEEDQETKDAIKVAKRLLELMSQFMEMEEEYLFLDANANPGLENVGFTYNEENGVYYVDKAMARALKIRLESFLNNADFSEKERALGLSRNDEEEEGMPEKTTETQEGTQAPVTGPQGVTLSQEEYKSLKANQDKVAILLQEQKNMAARLSAQEADLYRKDVETFVKAQSLPVNGRGHVKPVLDTVKSMLLGEPVGADEEGKNSIQLSEEDFGDVAAVHKYYRDSIRHLLSVIPREVPEEEVGKENRPSAGKDARDGQRRADIRLAASILGVSLEETAEKLGLDVKELKEV